MAVRHVSNAYRGFSNSRRVQASGAADTPRLGSDSKILDASRCQRHLFGDHMSDNPD